MGCGDAITTCKKGDAGLARTSRTAFTRSRQLIRRHPSPRLIFEINVSELLAVVIAQASRCSTDPLRWFCARYSWWR
jgi:hypothetical protein